MPYNFSGKTVVIVSQQDWGAMFISKHHYAVELAKKDCKVYFMDSPEHAGKMRKGEIVIEDTQYDNVYRIRHSFFYPYVLKFKAKWLHEYLVKIHVNKILKTIERPVDVVWSFDISETIPLSAFPSGMKKIFMPVDEPDLSITSKSALVADAIFSVTNEILDKYTYASAPRVFINHGVSEYFLAAEWKEKDETILKIGLSGNLLRPDIDRAVLLTIINEHKDVEFHFFGAYETSNLSGAYDEDADRFVSQLKQLQNVRLHGAVNSSKLADALSLMDGFLICYDISKDQSGGTNYHKVLEYMATGKVIVSNNVTTYASLPGLLEMPAERNNEALPALFNKVVNNIAYYNDAERQKSRLEYARQHTYKKNIEKIESYLN